MKDATKYVKEDKGAHQEKEGFGSSGLRGGSGGEVGPMNVLHSLQDENRGTAGPEHEPQIQHIRKCHKY
jgi:hypothetical protein